MSYKNTIAYIPMTSIASSAVSGTYQAVNTGGTPNACFLYKIINNSTNDVTISLDGVHDNDYVPSKSACIFDLQANKQPNNDISALAQGSTIYIKGTAGTGNIYFVGLYQARGQ